LVDGGRDQDIVAFDRLAVKTGSIGYGFAEFFIPIFNFVSLARILIPN